MYDQNFYKQLEETLALQAWGVPFVPVVDFTKRPMGKTWPEYKTTDKNQMRLYITEQFPGTGPGIFTGCPSAEHDGLNVVVMDIDPRNGGNESERQLIEQYGDLPDTAEVITGGGGKHLYFYDYSGLFKNMTLAQGIDFKGARGFVVSPPSLHPSGNRYYWKLGQSPLEKVLAPVPDWILLSKMNSPTIKEIIQKDNVIKGGTRHTIFTSLAGALRRMGHEEDYIRGVLRVMHEYRTEKQQDQEDFLIELAHIARDIAKKPIPPISSAKEKTSKKDKDDDDKENPFNAIAELILAEHELLTDKKGFIYKYNGKYLENVEDIQLFNLALLYCGETISSDYQRKENLSYLKSKTFMADIPWRNLKDTEIAFVNGVLDISTGQMREHRKEDYLETVIKHDYDPSATCPSWLSCLTNNWFKNDADADKKIQALQEFIGYTLLPHAKYKKALLCFGPSNTGKTVISHVIIEIVGRTNTSLIPLEKMGDPRAIAPIKGKMLNVVGEVSVKAMIADGGFKQLISTQEPVLLDQKYKEAELYVPFAKHAIFSNTLPLISDHTEAVFNRLLIIEFKNVIPEAEQDKHLNDKLSEEIEGIINWAIEGLKRLVNSGGQFTIPESSIELIAEYKHEQNPINVFIEERCEEDEGSYITMEEFRKEFYDWYKGPKYAPRTITAMLRSAGYTVKKKWESDTQKTPRCLMGYKVKPRDRYQLGNPWEEA